MSEVYRKVARNNFLFKLWSVNALGQCLQGQDNNLQDAINI